MNSSYFRLFVGAAAFIASASTLVASAFSLDSINSAISTTRHAAAALKTTPYAAATPTSLSMGIFDAFQKAFSNEEYGDPPEAIKATARHILVPSIDDVNAVLQKIASQENTFAALAGEYSTCPSKARGGSLGSFGPGVMVKEFDDVVFSPQTKVGEVVGPVQTKFGYHLIVVDKRSGGSDWY